MIFNFLSPKMDSLEEYSLTKQLIDNKVGIYLNNDPIFGSYISNSQNESMLVTIDQNNKMDEITVSLHSLVSNLNDVSNKFFKPLNNESIFINVEDKENILLISSQDDQNQLFSTYSDMIIDVEPTPVANQESYFEIIKEKSSQLQPKCCRKHEKYFKNSFKKKMNMRKKVCLSWINIIPLFTSMENDIYLKPKFSHNILCAFAIWSHDERKMEVSQIYKFLWYDDNDLS